MADNTGGNATSSSTGTAYGDSYVEVSDRAFGGGGGSVNSWSSDGNGGKGGNATSSASGSNAGSQSVYVNSAAYGGNGGSGLGGGADGAGGNASSHAQATSGGYAQALAAAQGGAGSVQPNLIVSEATATGGAGFYAQANAGRADGNSLSALASSNGITGTGQAKSSIGQTTFSGGAGLDAVAYGTALPTDAAANAALAGHPNVQQDFDVGGSSDIWLLGTLGAEHHTAASGAGGYHSQLSLTVDTTGLTPQDFLVGLLSPQLGAGSLDSGDSLTFSVDLGGDSVLEYSQTFTDLTAAGTFFSDNTLNLGPWTGYLGSGSLLTAVFMLDLTTSTQYAGLSFNFIAGNSSLDTGQPVPVPAAVWLFGSALAALGVIGRRRRSAATV